ncbi:ATP-dependent nuclease [Nostoc sp.]|uniref:ATP-dependent nuclease n=1 Tax=Nostoc sp. TaxID=1180 RepID=UPI002FF931CD
MSSAENIFLQYLNYFELFLILSREIPDIKLHPVYLYFSPYRGDSQQNLQANLSSDNIDDLVMNYFASTSKSMASLVKVSSLYFAEKRRNYESQSQGYQTAWSNDKEVKLVTKYLKKLGYSWDLKLKNKNKNIYEIMLPKDDRDFYIGQASSGEKEIINFLFGIFAFNIKNGLIIVDEAELHLHPKWQSILIELFIDLSKDTGNQFILSTHSAVFINETTISNIIRIYKENNTSNAIAISKNNLNKTKDLLHIINSHNNEKMFFADKVVLVEGVKDRLIFQKIIDIYSSEFIEKPEIIEVLEVLGKSNLIKYREFLDLIKVKNYIIADNDYILTIGDEDVKKLFTTDYQRIDKEVIKDKKSIDGKCLSEKMENAIHTKNIDELQELWEYIKNRKQKRREELTSQELPTLESFLNKNFQKKTYILEKGEIEDYLPNGYKDLNQVIELVKDQSFLQRIDDVRKQEINKIVFDILEIPCPKEEEIIQKLTFL